MGFFKTELSAAEKATKEKLDAFKVDIERETEKGLRDLFDIDYDALPEVFENIVSTKEDEIKGHDANLELLRQRTEEVVAARANAVEQLAKAKQMQAVLVPPSDPAPVQPASDGEVGEAA